MLDKNKKSIIIGIFAVIISAIFLFAFLSKTNKVSNENVKDFNDIYGFNDEDIKIGVMTGSSLSKDIERIFDRAQVVYLSGNADLLNAINTGKIDAIAHETINAKYLINANKNLEIVSDDDNVLGNVDYALCFNKNEKGRKLLSEFNSYLENITLKGDLDNLIDKWSADELEESLFVDYKSLPNINGKLVMYTEAKFRPFTFVHYNNIVGIDIALATEFCREKGYALDIIDINFESVIPALISGKCDMVGSGVTITDERKERVYFSKAVASSKVILIKNNENEKTTASIVDELKDSFSKTFVKENRYKLFLNGISTTLLITLVSFFLGSALGFILYLLYYIDLSFIKKIFDILNWVFKRLPNVVFLMILFFIIFGRVSISGILVSIIGFSILFTITVFFIINTAINSIDKNQVESAKALGYSKNKIFFKILLPQVAKNIIMSFRSEIINLIKSTAIVGYVMVTDLTKAGDIVRSRSYEAFFPLIVVAVIYILLAEIIIVIINMISKIIIKSMDLN